VEPIRYRPGEAIRWLQTGADDIRRSAGRKGKSIVRREGHRTIGKDIKQAAGALLDLGKSALADLAHSQAMASEYVLHDTSFEVVKAGSVRSYDYGSVTHIDQKADRLILALGQGSVTIKPHAYIVAGRIKVPVGWVRNGLEVPYEVLLDELAARCGVEISFE
jgi:hypothetical protein